jgi:hypothetical protein
MSSVSTVSKCLSRRVFIAIFWDYTNLTLVSTNRMQNISALVLVTIEDFLHLSVINVITCVKRLIRFCSQPKSTHTSNTSNISLVLFFCIYFFVQSSINTRNFFWVEFPTTIGLRKSKSGFSLVLLRRWISCKFDVCFRCAGHLHGATRQCNWRDTIFIKHDLEYHHANWLWLR